MNDVGWDAYRIHVIESLDRIETRQTTIYDKVGKLEVVAAKHGAFWGVLSSIGVFIITKLTGN